MHRAGYRLEQASWRSLPGRLALFGYGGESNAANRYEAIIGLPVKNQWYDFVYHVRWSSGSDGFFDAWVNGEQVLSHRGPTLYAGQGVYMKLANYHNPICDPYPACIGTHEASSVIHDRIRRGTTALSVARGPLEGELELVDGDFEAAADFWAADGCTPSSTIPTRGAPDVSVSLVSVDGNDVQANVVVRLTENSEDPLGGLVEYQEWFTLTHQDGSWKVRQPSWPYYDLACEEQT